MKIYRLLFTLTIITALPAMALAGSYGQQVKDKISEMTQMDIVKTAQKAGSFTTLVAALKAADLTDTLTGDGPFTVFAPTDAAFAALPDGTVDDLLKPENKEKLQSILTYHVVSGKVMAKDAVNLTSAKTVNGQSFKITQSGDGLKVDDANVTKADIEASNGIIHVIDRVIMP